MTIGVVGYGEAGSAIAASLRRGGLDVVAIDIRLEGSEAEHLRARADNDGVVLVEDLALLVAEADVVLSLVTASSAVRVIDSLAGLLGPRHVVADMNSISPVRVREMHATVEATGASFADVAIMGAVGRGDRPVPMLACGPGATRLAASVPPLALECIDGDPGTASAVKLLRSLVVKGLEAVVAEFHLVAEQLDGAERAVASLDDSLPLGSWGHLISYLGARTAVHGDRRSLELGEVASMTRDLGIEPIVSEAGARRLRAEARRGHGVEPRGLEAPERMVP